MNEEQAARLARHSFRGIRPIGISPEFFFNNEGSCKVDYSGLIKFDITAIEALEKMKAVLDRAKEKAKTPSEPPAWANTLLMSPDTLEEIRRWDTEENPCGEIVLDSLSVYEVGETCEDCKGTGQYHGLFVTEDCQKCKGKGKL
jgi:hypothetical protein